MFGGAVVNLIINLQHSHPERTFAVKFEPLLLVGTTSGVIFNAMFPAILILILLILVL